ncbi:MAG: hypothetical protein ACYCZO_01925 [Daejeonella sp.]
MHIKIKRIAFQFAPYIFFLFFLTSFNSALQAQVVWQDPDSEVYNFLSRQANKGNIEFRDLIQPVPRKEIAGHLQFLQDSVLTLTNTEKAELTFYLKEFSEFRGDMRDTLSFLKTDAAGRWRFLSASDKGFLLRAEPIFSLGTEQSRGKSVLKPSNGFSMWGHVGSLFSFQAYFEDITESGTGIDSTRYFTPKEGIVRTVTLNQTSINYSRLKGNITYAWNKGSISAGKDNLLYGYGENGRIILSDKAPSYPQIRLDYRPLKWLQLNYTHAWLHSGLIDSARSYPKGNSVYGNNREFYIPKFLASHSLNFYPLKGLSFSLGESMVYSDQLKAAYLVPVMFFKAYDQYESRYDVPTGSNGQFFLQASSRNHIPRTHLYTSLFIDEIRMTQIFNKARSRNQVGFTLGASVEDVAIPYLALGIEYTRINPFVYQNLIPAQNYTSQDYSLGDWMGQNADRLSGWAKYNPAPRLATRIQLDILRKGADGRLNDQYFAEPQPPFLSGRFETQKQVLLEAKYQLLNQLTVSASYFRVNGIVRPALQTSVRPEEFRIGIFYGL